MLLGSTWLHLMAGTATLLMLNLIVMHHAIGEMLPEAFVFIDSACQEQLDSVPQNTLNKWDEDHFSKWNKWQRDMAWDTVSRLKNFTCGVHLIRKRLATKSTEMPYIMVGAHHKTGSRLAVKIFATICRKMALVCGIHTSGDTRENMIMDVTSRNISIHSVWKKWKPDKIVADGMGGDHMRDYKFVHFVRHPCSIIASGYGYHKKAPETWTHYHYNFADACKADTLMDLCMLMKTHNETKITDIERQRTECENHISVIENRNKSSLAFEITKSVLCTSHKTIIAAGMRSNYAYADALNALSYAEGVRLEAVFSYMPLLDMLWLERITERDERVLLMDLDAIMKNYDNEMRRLLEFLNLPRSMLRYLQVYDIKSPHSWLYKIFLRLFKRGHVNKNKQEKKSSLNLCRNDEDLSNLFR